MPACASSGREPDAATGVRHLADAVAESQAGLFRLEFELESHPRPSGQDMEELEGLDAVKVGGNVETPSGVMDCAVHLHDTGQDGGGIEVSIEIDERSEEHTSELQSLMRISYAAVCWKKKTQIRRLK